MSLTKASYSMITGAPYNVLDYGADPTGAADSTAAFIAAIGGYSEQREIYVPTGVYKIANTLGLGINKRMFGEGSALTKLTFNSSDLFCITGDAFTQIEGLTIQKIVAAARTGIASYTPTTANGFRNGIIRDVVITDFDVGIGSTQGLTQGLMFNNAYENVRIYNATTGVQMGAGSNTNTWTNCSFWNCATAVQLNNVTSQIFVGCNFENSTTYDFVVAACYNIAFKTCYFEPAIGGTFDNSTGSFDTCHSTAFKTSTTQFVTYVNNSTISINDFTDYNFGGSASYVTQWYARSGDTTGYARKSNVRVRTGTAKADELAVAPPYNSGTGTATVANAGTQTIATMSGTSGRYDVYATIRASGNTTLYASFATAIWDTTGSRIVASNGTNAVISISGANIIVTNSTGSSQTFDYGYLRIGPL